MNWKNQTLMRLCYYFQMKDFNPDDSDDLQIDEPDCNGTWTLIKIISVYTPIDEKDNYDFYV